MNKVPKLNLKKNNSFLFIIVLLAFFSSITAFSQTENVGVSSEETLMNPNNVVLENPVKVSGAVNSNVNFILWFMGTKGDMGGTFSNGDMYSKKSFMTSGREPNRLLVKSLLKKALNIKSC